MAITSLVDLEMSVPDPAALEEFWLRRGLARLAEGNVGSAERGSMMRLREGTYRHVSELRLGCDAEADLATIAARLDALGVPSTVSDGRLTCDDPVLDHRVVVEVTAPPSLAAHDVPGRNRPGDAGRSSLRAPAAMGSLATTPRRLGHVVFGTPDVPRSRTFYVDGLGFRMSDSLGEFAHFLRCSPDHHNMLLMPSPVPCMNHYAMEMDDIDAIGIAGTAIVKEAPDCSVAGVGRHVVGSNMFWYLLDPAGGMFELYTDMDQIHDDERWAAEEYRNDWSPFEVAAWNATGLKPDFFAPSDLAAIAAAREKAGR